MIEAIVFDCFGVLTSDSWKEFRDSLPKFQQTSASDLNHRYGAGLIRKQQFLAGVSAISGQSEQNIADLIDNEKSKNTKLLSYIEILKTKYKIGLLSNVGSDWIKTKFLTKEEQALFDSIVLSYEIGTTKPDPKIYLQVCSQLKVKPDTVVLVDDISAYCKAAENLGMKAIVYKDFNQMKDSLERILTGAND